MYNDKIIHISPIIFYAYLRSDLRIELMHVVIGKNLTG